MSISSSSLNVTSPLEYMLWLVVNPRFSAPSDDEDAGYPVDLIIQQRSDGIDDIADAAVLKIDDRYFPCRKMVPAANAAAFPSLAAMMCFSECRIYPSDSRIAFSCESGTPVKKLELRTFISISIFIN